QQLTPADLLYAGHKVVGSAQRKYHRALLQHGSILLQRSEHTPALPGLEELTDRSLPMERLRETVTDAFAALTGWQIVPTEWSPEEREMIKTLAAEKYATADWNDKR